MNINIVSAAGETTLPSGSTLTGTISTAGTENWYVINVTSAGNYTIETSQSGTLEDTVMYLYDHTKATEIGYNDDISYPSNPYSRISIDLSKNINYFVKVKFWSSSETGSYKISLTKNSTPSYTTETVSKKFSALHAAKDTDPFDAKAFAQAMINNSWTATVTSDNSMWSDTGTLTNMKSSAPNIMYWSGHGLSSGRMSYFTSGYSGTVLTGSQRVAALQNPNHSWTIHCNNYYVDYSSASPMHGLVGTSWNGSLDWVVLAVCNQLTTPENRQAWSETMKGSSRKVKGIMGYSSTAPVSGDDTIASSFVDLCFNSTYKRVLFAWLQANGISSSYTASALYHSINEGDTLTSVTKHNSSTGNNFKYMYMINTSTYETDITPFSSLNTFRNIYEFAPNINNLVAANLTMVNIYESCSNKLYEEIIIEEPQYESTELENERVDFELDNLYETKNETEKKLKSKNVLPSDAVLRNIVTFISEDISGENAEVLGYMFNYGHSLDGIDITSDLNGDYLKVFVNKKGIEYVKKRWTNIETIKSKKQLGDKKVINVLIGKEKVKELVNKSKNREIANQIKISSGKIVYVRNAKNPNKYIPAWEYELDSGELIHVDCISGDIVEE